MTSLDPLRGGVLIALRCESRTITKQTYKRAEEAKVKLKRPSNYHLPCLVDSGSSSFHVLTSGFIMLLPNAVPHQKWFGSAFLVPLYGPFQVDYELLELLEGEDDAGWELNDLQHPPSSSLRSLGKVFRCGVLGINFIG